MKKIIAITSILLFLSTGCSITPNQEEQSTTPSPALTAVAQRDVGGTLIAEGRVMPIRQSALSMAAGGIVAELLVAEGEKVQANQLLLRLDQSRAKAMLAEAEAQLASAQASYEQLRSGATPEQIAAAEAQLRSAQAQQRQTGGSVTAADHAAAQAQLAQAKARLVELQAGPKVVDLRAAEAQLAQARVNLSTQRDQLSAAKTRAELQMQQRAMDLSKAQIDYADARRTWEYVRDTGEDPATNIKLNDLQQQRFNDAYVQAEANLRSAENTLEQARVAYDAARQAEVTGIQLAEQQVNTAQANLDKLKTSTNAADIAAARAAVASSQAALDKLGGEQRNGSLAAAQAAVDQAQANLDQLRAGTSGNALAVAEASVQSAQAALTLAKVTVDEAELHAPFAGSIAQLHAQPGEYVMPGTPVLQLADLTEWEIETTDLTENNIVHVREGNAVSVTFDALPDVELQGQVSRIRPLGENKQGDITYAVTISLAQQDTRLYWNMTTAVAIETD